MILLATARDLPIPDTESEGVVAALRARGIDARMEAWDDPSVDWSAASLVVIRSTWNYTEHLEAFLQWVDGVAGQTTLHNPAAIVRWNHHKQYLVEMADAGVPVVPTTLVTTPGDVPDLRGDLILKPAVSVGAIDTIRCEDDPEAARAHLDHVLQRGVALVQPYCASIADAGERSLLYFDGELSHTICKVPASRDFRVHEHFGGKNVHVAPADADRVVADAALRFLETRFGGGALLYARVDVVDGPDGPALSEIELIEPYFYLRDTPSPDAARARLVDAILRACP